MRDPNRLYNFYNEVTRLHMTYRPDWRIGQFWDGFKNGWMDVNILIFIIWKTMNCLNI